MLESELAAVTQAAASDELLRTSPIAESLNGPENQPRLRDLLAKLATVNRPRIRSQQYPPAVLTLIAGEFDRVERAVRTESDDYFDWSRYAIRCDLRVLCFGRVPVGVSQMEIEGVPRRMLYSGGLRQGMRFLRTMMATGGHYPFFRTHFRHYGITPLNFRLVNSAENRIAMYLNIADCLEMHPRCRGYFQSSWWLDPALDAQGARLEYIRQTPLENGGVLFRYGPTESAQRDALANSTVRQKLFGEGRYVPNVFSMIWPRNSMLAWAKRYRSTPTDDR